MAAILPYRGITPRIAEGVFIAEGAVIVGDVEVGENSSVWFNAVIRGDVNSIRIGSGTNVQDGAILHVTHKKFDLKVGDNVTIGHGAVLHGCRVENLVLVGMGSILLDGSTVGPESMVAAGAVVREGSTIPPGVLVAGVPAKVIRPLTEEERDFLRQSAKNYVQYVHEYRSSY